MFFTLKELVKWFGLTPFELWMHVTSVLIFSVLTVLKQEGVLNVSWLRIFIPLFGCDALCTYFCVIVFIRTYKNMDLRKAGIRLLSSAVVVICVFVFKLLLYQKLTNDEKWMYSEVFAPIFVLLMVMMVRACQVH